MVESNNPFAGDLPPGDSAEFADLGAQNGEGTDPAIVGDNSTLKIAVEGERVQPLNIDGDPHSIEPTGTPATLQQAISFTATPHAT